MSVDAYLAGPKGEYDWIVQDPEVDFAALFARHDTLLVGRHTFEVMHRAGQASMPGMKTVVFSRTLARAITRKLPWWPTSPPPSCASCAPSPARTSGYLAADNSFAACSKLSWWTWWKWP